MTKVAGKQCPKSEWPYVLQALFTFCITNLESVIPANTTNIRFIIPKFKMSQGKVLRVVVLPEIQVLKFKKSAFNSSLRNYQWDAKYFKSEHFLSSEQFEAYLFLFLF